MIRFTRVLPVSLVLAAGLLFGEAAVGPAQEAQADDWQYYLSPQGTGCEGCCSGGPVLCCASGLKCRIQPT